MPERIIRRRDYRTTYIWKGISFGSALAMVLSYVKSSSILLAIVHGLLSWFYVIYRIFIDYNLI